MRHTQSSPLSQKQGGQEYQYDQLKQAIREYQEKYLQHMTFLQQEYYEFENDQNSHDFQYLAYQLQQERRQVQRLMFRQSKRIEYEEKLQRKIRNYQQRKKHVQVESDQEQESVGSQGCRDPSTINGQQLRLLSRQLDERVKKQAESVDRQIAEQDNQNGDQSSINSQTVNQQQLNICNEHLDNDLKKYVDSVNKQLAEQKESE